MAQPRETLARIPLFRSLDEEAIRELEARCLRRRYAADAEVLGQGEDSTDVYFVLGGAVRVRLPSPRRIEATLARMPAAVFRAAIQRHPDACDQILRLLTARIRALDLRVSELSALGVRDRVRAELLRLGRIRAAAPNEAVISPPPYHADLAARVSTHREAVTRELNALERAGLLERRRGALVIRDVAALAALLERAEAPG